MRARHTRGTTLIELLVATVMLAVCAAVILDSVTASVTNADYARRRSMAFALMQDQVAAQRVKVPSGAVSPGTSTATLVAPGNITVTVTTTVALVGGYLSLYSVNVVGTWTEPSGRAEQLTLATLMRSPDG